jgi:uridine kinase
MVVLVLVLLLACPAASGKTTVCDRIVQRLHDQCVVMLNQDSFYRTLTAVRWGWRALGDQVKHQDDDLFFTNVDGGSSSPLLLPVGHWC